MINYKLIDESIKYYVDKGFVRIETPWLVSEYVDNLTKPIDVESFQLKHNNKCLVASGEQSFLYLYLKDFLPKGQFQTVTPCFRAESYDFSHSKYFIKNELIKTKDVNIVELEKIVDICLKFYKNYIPDVEIIKTEFGYDINFQQYELGSYGIRESSFLEWIYGTGCAEPRLSKIIKLYKNGLS